MTDIKIGTKHLLTLTSFFIYRKNTKTDLGGTWFYGTRNCCRRKKAAWEKTTLCGMLIQYLCEKGKGPILAVDADANSNLNEVLGVKVETTLGDVREEIARAELAKRESNSYRNV